MARLHTQFVRFLLAEDGPTAVEYAMMLMLVFMACLTAIVAFGQSSRTSFENSSERIEASITRPSN